MVEIVTEQDMRNTKRDIEDIGRIVGTNQMISPRYGAPFESWPFAVRKILDSGGFRPMISEAAIKAYVPTVIPSAAKDMTTMKIWWYGVDEEKGEKVPSWHDTGLSELDRAKGYTDSFDTLTINSGKPFPFAKLTRKGISSEINKVFADAILDIVIINADPNKFYKLEFIMNGAASSTSQVFNKDGWGVYAYDRDEFADSEFGDGEIVINYSNPQPLIDRTKVTKVTLKPAYESDLSIEVIIDGRKLPDYGSIFVRSALDTDTGFSWIIDPICYKFKDGDILYKEQAPREFLYNRGQYFPFVEAKFNEISSTKNQAFLDIFKDIRVENAEDGYRYSLAYYTNGSTSLGADYHERWIVFKRKVEGYTEASATGIQITSLKDKQQTLLRSGGIESISLKSSGDEIFHIAVDTSKLPAYGTYITAAQPVSAGYSWYLAPSTYSYAQKSTISQYEKPYFSYDAASKSFIYRFQSGPFLYEWGFGVNGANGLPNFKHIKRSLSTDIEVEFDLLQGFSTDWLPPLIFKAVNNGNDKAGFTGGNHLIGDEKTAISEAFIVYINGEQIDTSKNLSKYVDSLEIKVINKLMAGNTVDEKRYVLRQVFDISFNSSSIDVHCEIKALEKINMLNDYALQITTTSFNDTVLMLNAKDISRAAYTPDSNSGDRDSFPDANVAIMKGPGGLLCSWVDRNYGNCKPENCAPDLPLIMGGGGSNTKLYQAAFRSYRSTLLQPLVIDIGDEYKWRGGYYLSHDNATELFDSVVNLDRIVAVIDGKNYF